MKIKHFSHHFKEEAIWGEKEVIKFRWVLILAILFLIGNIYLSGYPERALVSFYLAFLYFIYNAVLNYIIKRNGQNEWMGYISSFIDVTVLSLHLFTYAYIFEPSAVITAASILLYPVVILLSVLRYDGVLVIFTTTWAIITYNIIYFILRPHISPDLLAQEDLFGWTSMFYRSVYFGLLAFYLFFIPKLLEKLTYKQIKAVEETKDVELKLALEQREKEIALKHLEAEKELYEKLSAQKEMIEQQNLMLQELMSTKDKLFSIIGHDLRTPFAIQKSIGDLLLSDFDNQPKEYLKECVTDMRDASSNGIMLLSNLLEWAKSQNSLNLFNPTTFVLEELLDEVIQLLGNNYKFKNIELNKLFKPELNGLGDIQMLKTLFRNILSNAIKFTPMGGRIDIYADANEEKLLISFKDNGIGIKPEKLPKLFHLELEISTLGTNLESGSGLGLVLCKDLVEKHNGRIWVESDGKRGTEFFIELPLKKPLLKRQSRG